LPERPIADLFKTPKWLPVMTVLMSPGQESAPEQTRRESGYDDEHAAPDRDAGHLALVENSASSLTRGLTTVMSSARVRLPDLPTTDHCTVLAGAARPHFGGQDRRPRSSA
jgi:hypothetical protein